MEDITKITFDFINGIVGNAITLTALWGGVIILIAAAKELRRK